MMGPEVLDLNIRYFDEDRLKNDLSKKPRLSPHDRSWGDYFITKLVENAVILDKITIDGNIFYVLDNDILWFEAIPTYIGGKFEWVQSEYSSLYSIKDMLRRDKAFGVEDPFYTKNEYKKLLTILDRNDKLNILLN